MGLATVALCLQLAAAPTPAGLAQEVVRLRSIDPADQDYSDLAGLRAALGNARIVQLGEQTHGDGAAFSAKVRLVEFLHRELGFQVLAFESGLYDCHRAWQSIRAGDDPAVAARDAIFPIWSASRQVRPLWEYLGRAARSRRPLELAGFDSQFTGRFSVQELLPELERFLEAPGLLSPLRVLVEPGRKAAPAERQALRHALDDAERRLGTLTRRRSPPEVAFWRQLLRSTRAQAELQFAFDDAGGLAGFVAQSNNGRDAQMADNLIWLAEQRYPGRKIIVWGATMHLIRNAAILEQRAFLASLRPYEKVVNMGQLVAQHFGPQVYTLGFLAYQGHMGILGGLQQEIGKPPAGSFDDLLGQTGGDNLFLDLRGRRASWVAAPRIARPLGYAEMSGDWSRVLDGFLFTRTMVPSDADRPAGSTSSQTGSPSRSGPRR
jgi:erythromycin esterase